MTRRIGNEEAPVWIAVNGRRIATLSCSPHDLEALAAGHLIGEGWIDEAAQIHALHVVDGPGGARGVEVNADADRVAEAAAVRRHQAGHGCGARHLLDCEPGGLRGVIRDPDLPATPEAGGGDDRLPLLFRALFAAADDAADGGVHAAALIDDASLAHISIDIARHCAVDRAIGLAVRAGEDPARYAMILTARVSGAIALKCARSGIRRIASRSIATSLAHEIAAAAGVDVIERGARARGGA